MSRLLFYEPMNDILDEYGRLLEKVDRWFGRSMAHAGERIRCAAGCAECCRSLFDITLIDAAFLKRGFDQLDEQTKRQVLTRCRTRLTTLKQAWPEFDVPYLLNYRPEDDWELLMPDEDETPCPLVGADGRCLVYAHRPMTCRLHGLPLIDRSGEVLHDEWCTLNFINADPLADEGLREDFTGIFREEVRLFRHFVEKLFGRVFLELDTFIPTALLIDFTRFDWQTFAPSHAAPRESDDERQG